MDSLDEPNAQSFIVKVWVEDSAGVDGQGVWHGHITHVSDHQRRYLKSLDEIEDFIAPHLEEMGVKLGLCWRLRYWLKQLRRRSQALR
jgi:hypothetical protein